MKIEQISRQIKDNLPLIVLLPAILGGLWQLIELSKMSISFIRFFSPTQLLPDGLLMLFVVFVLYFAYKIGEFNNKKKRFKRKIIDISEKKPSDFQHYFIKVIHVNKLIYIDNPIYQKKNVPVNIILIFIGIALFWLVFSHDSDPKHEFLSFAVSITFFAVYGRMLIESAYILLIIAIESKTTHIISIFLSNKPILKEFLLLPFRIIIIVFSFALFLILPIYIFTFFHQKFFLPANLKNLKYIESSLNTKDYNQSNISYFNDKYIFIEHIKDGNSTIEILKFENLFENNQQNQDIKDKNE